MSNNFKGIVPVDSVCTIDGFLLTDVFAEFDYKNDSVKYSGIVKVPQDMDVNFDKLLGSDSIVRVYDIEGITYTSAVVVKVCESHDDDKVFIECIGKPKSSSRGIAAMVVCVDNKSVNDLLTNGKKYRILSVNIDSVMVICDKDFAIDFNQVRFRRIEVKNKKGD